MSRFLIVVSGDSQDRDETIRGIRQLLKRLGRNFGLRCVVARPITNEKSDAANVAQRILSPTGKGQSNDREHFNA